MRPEFPPSGFTEEARASQLVASKMGMKFMVGGHSKDVIALSYSFPARAFHPKLGQISLPATGKWHWMCGCGHAWCRGGGKSVYKFFNIVSTFPPHPVSVNRAAESLIWGAASWNQTLAGYFHALGPIRAISRPCAVDLFCALPAG